MRYDQLTKVYDDNGKKFIKSEWVGAAAIKIFASGKIMSVEYAFEHAEALWVEFAKRFHSESYNS